MAFSANSGGRAPMADINVTPLVDVMLVLLIIFMVTAPMMQEGVSVDLPQASGQPIERPPTQKETLIAVSSNGTIFVNEKEIPEAQLLQAVETSRKEGQGGGVYLRADKNVPYGAVVRIIGTLKSAGITNLGMITTPIEGSKPGK